MLTLRLQPSPLTPHTVGRFAGVSEDLRPIWCGRVEGWLTPGEFLRRTQADVDRYAVAQPLRFRQAMRRCALGFPAKPAKS